MAFRPKTIKQIERAVRLFKNFLKYKSVGPHSLSPSELKELVRSGLIDRSQAPRTAVARAYLKTHEQAVDLSVAPKSTRDGAVDFLERMFSRYAEKMGDQMSADVLGQIEAQVMPFTDRAEGQKIYDVLRDKGVHEKYLGRALVGQVKNWRERWKLIVNTELTRASQYGALDAITHNNRDKSPEEIMAFKIGPADSSTCEHCMRFWFADDGSTPRVYRLSELLANGSNVGKRRDQWKPAVDSTHPNERHKLVELRPGFGFKNGILVYIGKDHDEYLRQRRLARS